MLLLLGLLCWLDVGYCEWTVRLTGFVFDVVV